ncbi:family 20 glycosylhydrolase [Mucilaginibacter ginkgonis]|uniref:beta-N-acetylhexosaminidase n=1 Tax=Mucilaginibacter ginkgonis TaxID=2682091 RepID=A0A6I4HW41_9SPHI|nr:family 20 glycosylhydrolase [Mucilaginibacter ginkgonis]QQL51052.1 family 20 glycosylhydrolase [Mucilaginibacter ginkgonis]
MSFSFTKKIPFLVTLLAIITLNIFDASAQNGGKYAGIIPAPVKLSPSAGNFILSRQTRIIADSVDNKAVRFFAAYLKDKWAFSNQLLPNTGNTTQNSIVLTAVGTEGLASEGYRLTITPSQIVIAGKGAGLFYGIQTLMQLFPLERSGSVEIPCLTAEDYPRFGYRGLHLDVCRHFFSVQMVKRYIDLMAAYKLNTFHWHLTDDQGWRIEIKKYPKLTTVASQRAQTVIGNYHDRTPQQYDAIPYGGFYTQDQIREVVKYAADRYINVVPEIEMPGHATAALAAYPELGCEPEKQVQVAQTWGVFKDIYCPSDKTFAFLEDVLTEVMELFPSKYIHIGGDEVPKDAWVKSAFCQDMIKRLKLKNEHGLQSYFIQRIEKFVNSEGRSIIGWDEILEGGLAPNATVMSWRGEAGGIEAAKQNHDVIMTPGSGGMYLDAAQGKSDLEPYGIGSYAPLNKTYAYNPTPTVLTDDQKKHIVGVQANIWTEYIATDAKLEYMLLPRMLALAEVAWSPMANKDFTDFSQARLPRHLARLDMAGYNYRVPSAIGAPDSIMVGPELKVLLKSPVEGAKIYYSIDNYQPGETDLIYQNPFALPVPQDQYRQLQTVVVTPAGHRSVITKGTIYNRAALAALNFTPANQGGLKYKLLGGRFTNTDQINTANVLDTGIVKGFYTTDFKKANKGGFGVVYDGYIRVDADGKYTFSTKSYDGSTLTIDDQPVVVNDGRHSTFERGGEVMLQKGYHRFVVKYFDFGASGALQIFWTAPGKIKMDLTPDYLYY